jgi:hypothetical protein
MALDRNDNPFLPSVTSQSALQPFGDSSFGTTRAMEKANEKHWLHAAGMASVQWKTQFANQAMSELTSQFGHGVHDVYSELDGLVAQRLSPDSQRLFEQFASALMVRFGTYTMSLLDTMATAHRRYIGMDILPSERELVERRLSFIERIMGRVRS